MKTRNIILMFAAILVSTACTQKPSAGKDQALVDSLTTSATIAMGSGDINKLMSIYADDAIVLSNQMKLSGKDSITNGWKNVCQYAKNFKIYPGVSTVSKDMVFIEGLYTFDWNQGNYSVLAKGVIIQVWKKQADNTWKITYHEANHGDLPK
jgi:ketosteroid isomerase-like protein